MTNPQRIRAAPIRKTLRIQAPKERAFQIFTAQMGSWWIKGHSVLQSMLQTTTQSDVVIEPHAGGRWFEVGADGSEYTWGRVLAWDPPNRLSLAWQLTAQWAFDPSFETTIEVNFTAEGGGTLVTFEHRDLDRYGDAAAQVRDGMDSGWDQILGGFEAAAGGLPGQPFNPLGGA